ncbi:hypothetical protein SAMN05216207_106910 [Pseudonocardia ammonioxydans]|uniref:Uncharacterized protein n=1 Tax=Pseudonocardia ammonioxydans TaxID=260086 RepID=A0A1I5HM12_PSUAM|nr:hypothetical protein [Pseudonocardia ammonioxydans]SFO49335.1 hypothetical protein SAMN05216207_106910 [Pseudonocardia ammonioxydans]
MNAVESRPELRGAVYRGDAAAILSVLGGLDPAQCLQLGGDGLLIALAQDTSGATQTAQTWVAGLGTRLAR